MALISHVTVVSYSELETVHW